jgi:glucose/arabinose dehydrogenase/mono/diheme cytochrome c family protein
MPRSFRFVVTTVTMFLLMLAFPGTLMHAENLDFHNAPESARQLTNPYEGSAAAAIAGKPLYHLRCARCHGERGEGSGVIPRLNDRTIRKISSGELFWFITKGDVKHEMPSWASLPKDQRWRIVTYLKTMNLVPSKPEVASTSLGKLNLPLPKPPFVDFRTEEPGKIRKITAADLPEPFATESAANGPHMVSRPVDAWPKAPAGFKVELYAGGLENPRLLHTAPNGDIFLAEMDPGRIRVFRGLSEGKPELMQLYAHGLNAPYGIAFYPPGPDPQWLYVGNVNEVIRYPYHNGDLKPSGAPEHIADLPAGGGHTTRDIEFSLDGKTMYVAVGSASNVDDPDTTPAERNRATILAFNPDGSNMRVYASGIRNAGGGMAVNPKTNELWCSVNERDALGDNLVPDYITHVQEGGFYGWPWWYIGAHQDPRHKGKHPELKDKAIGPDVLVQPHNASLEILFYDGKQFPAEYQGDIFAGEHGSWNRAARAGYEVIRVPLHQTGHATGEYEDFLTGFVLDNGEVWGRPVGVTLATDGSLLVSDDGTGSIWRVSYGAK